MKKQKHTIGQTVEKFCHACEEVLVHIVQTVTKTGAVSKVDCSKCGLQGAFKAVPNLMKIQSLATKTGEPYDQRKTYRTGQIMSHPAFGTGEVMTVVDTKKIDVLFADRIRRLVHSRI